jgi:hypothetical protein
MHVELDVFSGRPNPRWELSHAEVAELRTRLAGLPRCDQPTDEPALGYRGLILSSAQAPPGLPSWIRVHDGVVTIRTDAGIRCHSDVNGLERWLIGQARARGHGGLLRELGK